MNKLFYIKYRSKVSRFIQILKIRSTHITGSKWIFSRCACLGNDVLKIINPNNNIYNIQKGRSDLILDIINNKIKNTEPSFVLPYLENLGIYNMIIQQSFVKEIFKLHPPEAIFIDSYSELTDQLFSLKDKSSFCVNYSDLKKNHNEIWKTINRKGLMDINKIENNYFQFFSLLRSVFENVPIVFIHFPTKLDKREKFKERGEIIKNTISNVKIHFDNFFEIEADDEIVDYDPHDIFPYHYNKETYSNISIKIRQLKLI
jgi:hypothetical protein